MPSPQPRAFAILCAAGASHRMGTGSKLHMHLLGRPVYEHTVTALDQSGCIAKIILMAPQGKESLFPPPINLGSDFVVVTGGSSRQESVRKGLEYLAINHPEHLGQLVLVHDAARCLVSPELIQRSVEVAAQHGAMTTAVSSTDSLIEVQGSEMVRALDRAKIFAVQTPQVFRYELLRDAHARGVEGATDDASLVRALCSVKVLEGERTNLKITFPTDLAMAEQILSRRQLGDT